MADRTLAVHRAIVARLEADEALGALIGDRIYDRAPQGPFQDYVRIGDILGAPDEAHGYDGWEAVVTIDTWSREYGSVKCRRIMAAVFDALHRAPLAVDGGSLVWCRLSDQRTPPSGDDQTTHGVQRFEILIDG